MKRINKDKLIDIILRDIKSGVKRAYYKIEGTREECKKLIKKMPVTDAEEKGVKLFCNCFLEKKGGNVYALFIELSKIINSLEVVNIRKEVEEQRAGEYIYRVSEIEALKKEIKALDKDNLLEQYRMKCRYKIVDDTEVFKGESLNRNVIVLNISHSVIGIDELDIDLLVEEDVNCKYHIQGRDYDKLMLQLHKNNLKDYKEYINIERSVVNRYDRVKLESDECKYNEDAFKDMCDYVVVRTERDKMIDTLSYRVNKEKEYIIFELIKIRKETRTFDEQIAEYISGIIADEDDN